MQGSGAQRSSGSGGSAPPRPRGPPPARPPRRVGVAGRRVAVQAQLALAGGNGVLHLGAQRGQHGLDVVNQDHVQTPRQVGHAALQRGTAGRGGAGGEGAVSERQAGHGGLGGVGGRDAEDCACVLGWYRYVECGVEGVGWVGVGSSKCAKKV